MTTVLIVEDDENLVILYDKLMDSLGLEIIGRAANGLECLELLNSGKCPDLVILDHRMPHMTGIEALPIIRERCPKAKIVIFTADHTFADGTGIKLGADIVIRKPIPLHKFREVIEGIISS